MNNLDAILDSDVFSRFCGTLERCTTGAIAASRYTHDVERCRDYFRSVSSVAPNDFYDSVSHSFSRRYLPVNLVKNLYLIDEIHQLGLLKNFRKVVDLGCGPGTFALAFAMWLHHTPQEYGPYEVKMVDASQNALDLFGKIWTFLSREFNFNVEQKTVHSLIDSSVQPFCEGADLIVLSNSLIEILRRDGCHRQSFLSDLANSGAAIAIIDYEYDECRRYLDEFSEHMSVDYDICAPRDELKARCFYQAVDLPLAHFENYVKHAQHLPCKEGVQFIKCILLPKNRMHISSATEMGLDLVQRYKEAWESHNLDLLASIFTKDAVYCEKYGEPPFCGLTQIVRYWQVNAAQQSEVSFTPRHIALENDLLKVDWDCEFFRRDKGKWYHLNGTFQANIESGRIRRFEENFEKTVTAGGKRARNKGESGPTLLPNI